MPICRAYWTINGHPSGQKKNECFCKKYIESFSADNWQNTKISHSTWLASSFTEDLIRKRDRNLWSEWKWQAIRKHIWMVIYVWIKLWIIKDLFYIPVGKQEYVNNLSRAMKPWSFFYMSEYLRSFRCRSSIFMSKKCNILLCLGESASLFSVLSLSNNCAPIWNMYPPEEWRWIHGSREWCARPMRAENSMSVSRPRVDECGGKQVYEGITMQFTWFSSQDVA